MTSALVKRKYASLVDKLYEKTCKGKVDWVYDEVLEDLSAVVSRSIIAIEIKRSPRGGNLIVMSVRSRDGTVMDSFNDEDLESIAIGTEGFHSYYEVMVELKNMGQRQATGADKMLDSLLSDIDDLE